MAGCVPASESPPRCCCDQHSGWTRVSIASCSASFLSTFCVAVLLLVSSICPVLIPAFLCFSSQHLSVKFIAPILQLCSSSVQQVLAVEGSKTHTYHHSRQVPLIQTVSYHIHLSARASPIGLKIGTHIATTATTLRTLLRMSLICTS